MKRRSKWALGALGGVAVVAAAVVGVRLGWTKFAGSINALHVDLAAPDAYISTPALSRLPHDLVKAPLARDLLTEDFAFYYEEHEDRLGLEGAVKRIAYEHDTTFADKLVALSLDEPAEVALWTDPKGAPRYWLVAMTRGVLAKTLQELGPIAASDSQLSAIGDLPGASGATKVMALTLSSRRTLAFVARGNRVVVLSDPGLLFDGEHHADTKAAKTIAALLSGDAKDQDLYRRRFGLGAAGTDHVLVADSSLLSFGYRHFFPGLRAVQVDVASGGGALRTQLRVDTQALPSPAAAAALWSGVPMGAAACSWLPADWTRARAVLDGVGDAKPDDATPPEADDNTIKLPPKKGGKAAASDKKKPKAAHEPAPASDETKAAWDHFVATLDGPAAICWYARSQLHTPLLIARTRADAPAVDVALARVAAWLIPGGGIALPPEGKSGAHRWQREVPAPYGPNGGDEVSAYLPTLSHSGPWIAFSPDDKLVELALATQDRLYPSVADTLPAGASTLAVVAPRQVADLVQQEADAVLPAQQELFRQAAETYLTPRLDAMRRWPAVRATPVGSPSSEGWVPVTWQPLADARGGAAPRAGAAASQP